MTGYNINMTACKHTRWLRLSRKDQGFALEVSDRAQRLLDGLPRPDNQSPGVIALIGNESKLRLLKELDISSSGPRGKRGHGEIHLFVVPSSIRTEFPLIIADGDIPEQTRLGRPCKPQRCHETTVRPIRSSTSGKVMEIAGHIYHRLLFPFADILCFFATDLGGLEQVVHHLALWIDGGQTSSNGIRPWLVIVADDGEEEELLHTFGDLMRAETSIDVMERFGGIRLISLTKRGKSRGLSARNPWYRLNGELLDVSQSIRQARLVVSCLFTAQHLAGFMQHAAVRAAEAPREPFNFIHTSRLDNPVASDLEVHLARFLSHFKSMDSLKSFALPMVASSFILDHYHPDMHGEAFILNYENVTDFTQPLLLMMCLPLFIKKDV